MKKTSYEMKAYIDVDVSFHLKLADMVQNTILWDIISSIQALLRAWIKSVSSLRETQCSPMKNIKQFLKLLNKAIRRWRQQ
jgi:DNA-binding GntR family transcriptional regulator